MTPEDINSITLFGLCSTVLLGILTLILPRRSAFLPIIIAACYITQGQQVVVASLHFTIIRILILFACARLIIRREISTIKFNSIDKTLILWVISGFIIYTLSRWTLEAFINRLGFAFDAIGLYFIFRFLIKDLNEINVIIKKMAIIIVPLGLAMLFEKYTGKNIFSIFGGIPADTIIDLDGRLRCQGAFRNPILAGTFGATWAPLLISLWWKKGADRLVASIGFIGATIIMLTAESSGPLLAYITGIIGLAVWPLRNHMRVLRWGILFAVISLHLIMKTPVWFLISRLSYLTGGHGWHRSYLIDQAIAHFNEWWLFGTNYTAHWMPNSLAVDLNRADITNQYIAEGISGGLVTMILFIAIIIYCFKSLGWTLRANQDQPKVNRITLWAMGSSLGSHVVVFFSIAYFDQIIVFWYLLLAMIATISVKITNEHTPAAF